MTKKKLQKEKESPEKESIKKPKSATKKKKSESHHVHDLTSLYHFNVVSTLHNNVEIFPHRQKKHLRSSSSPFEEYLWNIYSFMIHKITLMLMKQIMCYCWTAGSTDDDDEEEDEVIQKKTKKKSSKENADGKEKEKVKDKKTKFKGDRLDYCDL